MPDPISMVSGAIKSAKELVELAAKIQNVELSEKLVDLRIAMVDLKNEIVSLKETIASLEAEKTSLSDRLANAAKPPSLETRDGKYFIREPKTGESPGPYCVACHHKGGRLVPLHKTPEWMAMDNMAWECPACKAVFP